ncbi:tellurite resistance/C4-dicarboxylate transporter family protein [Streptomyces albiaxialis]|uniref:tellurite resistance/C4-dicarboxylate transporter family protein n=1 Tax=Streptomyces albiaxialis TaxID=329523 RepID=UPI0031D82BD4
MEDETRNGGIRDLAPACFAPVMATGIVSRALDQATGARHAADALLAAALALHLVLLTATVARAVRHRDRLAADLREPARFFGAFTLVAATGVLASRLATGPLRPLAAAAPAPAAALWAALALAGVRLLRTHGAAATRHADGTWFLATVGLQSLVVTLTSLAHGPTARAVALACWLAGVCLYAVTLCCVVRRLVLHPPGPAELAPSYWILMGAAAISLLAGCGIPEGPATTAALLALWGWATLLIPPLTAAGAWRHLRHRVPVRYEPALWSMVFPLGMYATATTRLATTRDLPLLRPWASDLAWCATTAWFAVAVLLLVRTVSRRGGHNSPANPGDPPLVGAVGRWLAGGQGGRAGSRQETGDEGCGTSGGVRWRRWRRRRYWRG